MDQVSLTSVMMRLLCRGQLGPGPPGRFRPGDAAFQYGTPAQLLCSFSWKLLVSTMFVGRPVPALSSSFHGKLYNRGSAHTTPAAGLASTGHLASVAAAPAAEASLAVR